MHHLARTSDILLESLRPNRDLTQLGLRNELLDSETRKIRRKLTPGAVATDSGLVPQNQLSQVIGDKVSILGREGVAGTPPRRETQTAIPTNLGDIPLRGLISQLPSQNMLGGSQPLLIIRKLMNLNLQGEKIMT